MLVRPSLGAVLSHGCILSKWIYVNTDNIFGISYNFFGIKVKIPSFAKCLSSFEGAVVKKALASADKDFALEVKTSLIAILSQYGC